MARENNKEKKYQSSSHFCGVGCLRGLLIALNFIFILGGACAFAVGIWTIVSKMEYVALLSTAYYNLIVILLIGAGIIVLITGIIGCIGAVRKNRSFLTVYFVLLLIIFLAELIAGILGFIYYDSIHAELSEDLKSNMNRKYNQTGEEALTKAVDEMQQDFKCCGVQMYSDWSNSTFILNNKEGLKTPLSCCKTMGPKCSTRAHPSNIYRVLGNNEMGCLVELERYFKEHLFVLAVTGIAVACLEVLVMLFACCLSKAIKDEEKEI